MPMLKDPQKSIPNGFKFHQPNTNWAPLPYSSLDSIVTQLIAHRQGRPDLMATARWSLDPAVVYQEVYAYNVAICHQMGYHDYLTGGEQSVPFPHHQQNPFQKLRNVVGGIETLVHWKAEGGEVVSPELANHRAEVCSVCPQNKPGGWESFFTVPTSNAIRREVGKKNEMKLETPHDAKLGTCGACTCPLSLMVWTPLKWKIQHLTPGARAALDPNCWVLAEEKASP